MTNALGQATSYDDCESGLLDSVTDPLGNTTTFTCDNLARRPVTTWWAREWWQHHFLAHKNKQFSCHSTSTGTFILRLTPLSALVEGKRFCHVRWLTDDPAIATIMNLDRVRGEDALPRLAKGMSVEPMREWLQQPQTELYAALPERFIAEWDSTVSTRYGHQADAAVGYNPHTRGRKSHHLLICVAARTRLCLHLEWRPGDTVSATDWQPAMEKLWSHATIRERLWLHRGDVGFGQEAVMAWHETEGVPRPKYVFKLKLTSNVRRAIAQVLWPLWEGAPTLGCQQLAETTVKLHGWSRERRVVIVRTLKPVDPSPQDEFWDTPEDAVAVYVTNLEKDEATPEQIALLYAQRADTENVFDELKNQWGGRGYCSQRAVVTELAARLVLLTYNLWSLFTRLLGLTPGHHSEAVKSRRDFLFLAAQVVESGRQRVVKLAVKAEWWSVLNACYERLRTWLSSTAPQLEAAGQILRRLARQTTENPEAPFLQPSPRMNFNCGIQVESLRLRHGAGRDQA